MSWCLKVSFARPTDSKKRSVKAISLFPLRECWVLKKLYWARVGFRGAAKKKFIDARHLKSFLLSAARMQANDRAKVREKKYMYFIYLRNKKAERAKWRRERRFANLVRCACVKFRGRWTFGSGESQINAKKKRLAVRHSGRLSRADEMKVEREMDGWRSDQFQLEVCGELEKIRIMAIHGKMLDFRVEIFWNGLKAYQTTILNFVFLCLRGQWKTQRIEYELLEFPFSHKKVGSSLMCCFFPCVISLLNNTPTESKRPSSSRAYCCVCVSYPDQPKRPSTYVWRVQMADLRDFSSLHMWFEIMFVIATAGGGCGWVSTQLKSNFAPRPPLDSVTDASKTAYHNLRLDIFRSSSSFIIVNWLCFFRFFLIAHALLSALSSRLRHYEKIEKKLFRLSELCVATR